LRFFFHLFHAYTEFTLSQFFAPVNGFFAFTLHKISFFAQTARLHVRNGQTPPENVIAAFAHAVRRSSGPKSKKSGKSRFF